MVKAKWWAFSYFVAALVYSWWSYSLTAPNLVLSSWAPYWQFQTWMWQTFFNNRPLLTYVFAAIITWWWISFVGLLFQLRRTQLVLPRTRSQFFHQAKWLMLLTAPLLFANNALSYDVFNYIFNAKMVMVYHANPHIKVALDFASDEWVRFMHNTHTPAPYGYGWTILSLLPFALGQGKFIVTWGLFRLASWLSWLGLALVIWWGTQQLWPKHTVPTWIAALVVLNPLVGIEIIANSHNDLWMVVPALIGMVLARLARHSKKARRWQLLGWSVLFIGASIFIKLATVALVPAWIMALVSDSEWWIAAAPALMMTPLLTPRSQQFHPWYLTWVFCWIPWLSSAPASKLSRSKKWWVWIQIGITTLVSLLTITSLYRYLPYLWYGVYTPDILNWQKLITWSAVPLTGLLLFLRYLHRLLWGNSTTK